MPDASATRGHTVVTGARGMLGRAVCDALQQRGIPHRALDSRALDITDPTAVINTITPNTTRVINCAAYTDVDGCETDEDLAMRINRDGVLHLAQRCRNIDATLVHISTDYVFPGNSERPYRPDDPIAPVNAYGRTKAAGERAILGVGGDFRVLRTSWLYAPWGQNFVRTIARLAKERDTLRVVNDQRGRPTSVFTLADAALRLSAEDVNTGVYHVADDGQCTWFEFARRIVETLGLRCDVEPCTSDAFPRPAARPAYSVLDLEKTLAALGKLPHWTQRLDETLARLEPEPVITLTKPPAPTKTTS